MQDWKRVGQFIGKCIGIIMLTVIVCSLCILAGFIFHGIHFLFMKGWNIGWTVQY